VRSSRSHLPSLFFRRARFRATGAAGSNQLAAARLCRDGTLVQYWNLARLSADGLLPAPTTRDLAGYRRSCGFSELALRRGGSSWNLSLQGQMGSSTGWVSFRHKMRRNANGFHLEAQKAAKAVGFPRQLAAQLVGALCENRRQCLRTFGKLP